MCEWVNFLESGHWVVLVGLVFSVQAAAGAQTRVTLAAAVLSWRVMASRQRAKSRTSAKAKSPSNSCPDLPIPSLPTARSFPHHREISTRPWDPTHNATAGSTHLFTSAQQIHASHQISLFLPKLWLHRFQTFFTNNPASVYRTENFSKFIIFFDGELINRYRILDPILILTSGTFQNFLGINSATDGCFKSAAKLFYLIKSQIWKKGEI